MDELAHANSDLQNLMNATAIATIFLDRDLRITRYTPSSVGIFHLIPTDVGRPITDLKRRIEYPDLESDAARVIDQLVPIEREVGDQHRWFFARVLPYRTVEDRIAGVVLTFVDVTERKRAEEAHAADLADTALLRDMAARLVREESSRIVFEEILAAAMEITAADAGTVQTYDPSTEELVILATRGFAPKTLEHVHRVGAGAGTPAGLAFKTGARIFIDVNDDATDVSGVRSLEAGYRSAQATPLVSGGGAPAAMLTTHWRTAQHRPTERQLHFLDLLARQATLVIEQQRAHEAIRAHEQRLRAVVENLPGGAVFIVDRSLRYQLAAGEAFVAAGFKSEQFLGHTVAEALGPELAAIFEPHYRRALEGDRFTETHQADGRELQTRGLPLRDSAGDVVGVLAVSFDVTERRRGEEALAATQALLEDRVRERTSDVQALFQRLISAQEDERRRIARDMHDQLGQQMTALRINVEALRRKANSDPVLIEQADRIQRLAEELDQSIDFLTWELRPAELDHFGLAVALRKLVISWSERVSIAAEFDTSGEDGRLPPSVETNVYRLVQEALHNVMKHARATHVTVFMTRTEDELTLVVEDNGRGIEQTTTPDRARTGLGLVSMRERAALVGGRLEIETRDGLGTAIFVRIPIGAAPAHTQ